MPQASRRPLPLLLLLGGLAALSATPLPAHAGGQSAAEKARAERRLDDVRSRLEALAKSREQTASERDKVNAELARRAHALAAAASAVRATEQQIAAKQKDLEQLQSQRSTLQDKLDRQKEAIADLLRATYALGQGSDLRLLLGDEDVARIARALAYSKYFQQDRVQRVQQLMADLGKLQTLEDAITREQQALEATRARQAEQARTLAARRAEQKKLADAIDATYRNESERLAALKQDEQSLTALVSKLQAAIDQAARESERRNGGHAARGAGRGPVLANIRGNLPWPAPGEVHSYGNGVLIRAPGGSEVRAVAKGRVVYANFLRGYGMLVILDHGGGWMSMYGNNETLLHRVGETVDAGEAIGTAMAPTGINTGAYFELRHANKPVDPRSWLARHR
ncbi:MAG: peptidoglycan DD-metalloendopeptidase family protein [Xanthomonadaceae bacterium]|nr:peptidoglycan DD-metalloendopeptidase family protein [Xanthomonadaceae bacterium]MDE1963974.1 peptidoglycan DD-metalloendopeptidase family protein [Xanthomonadaceae bacterium]